MELAEFTRSLAQMSEGNLRVVAATIAEHSKSAGHEVDGWKATIAIDRALRLRRRTRAAAHAAFATSQAVLTAATRAGIPLPDPAVTSVARSAAELARAIVADTTLAPELRYLVQTWTALSPLVAA